MAQCIEISAALRILRANPALATLDVREDFVALSDVVSRYRRSMAVKLTAGIILHGYYHPAAVVCMSRVLRLPSDRGLSGMQWSLASEGVYRDMLSIGRRYVGPQGFPYHWIHSGTAIAVSLLPHLSTLYDACVRIAASPRPSIASIDKLLPADLGRYSSSCMYMRRHLARWLAV